MRVVNVSQWIGCVYALSCTKWNEGFFGVLTDGIATMMLCRAS